MANRKREKHSEIYHGFSPAPIPRAAWTALADRFSWSAREAQIAQLLCENCLEKQIAKSLKISENTLHTYIRRLYAKMNVHNRPGFSSVILKIFYDLSRSRDESPPP
jgi:DNA-binding CsgD family transcriptional regulator